MKEHVESGVVTNKPSQCAFPSLSVGAGTRFFLPVVFAGVFICLAAAQTNDTSLSSSDAPSGVEFGHGVNLGNFFEGTGKYSGNNLKAEDFSNIQQAGFTLIRVPICWPAHVSPGPDYTIDPDFLKKIDWVVSQSEKNDLNAILDYHNDAALMGDPDKNSDRFIAIWKQVAEHYKDAPHSIYFELLNEPNQKMDAAHWNALIVRALDVIRPSNPDRNVVVGPVLWNKIEALPRLVLPATDSHLIVTIHYYDPMKFTHQGATWIHGSSPSWIGTTWGTDADKQAVTQAFDNASAWSQANKRPIYVGEFGTFNKVPMDGRATWTAFVAHTAETHNFAWTYWEYCSGFGVYDPQTHQWRQQLLDALLPK